MPFADLPWISIALSLIFLLLLLYLHAFHLYGYWKRKGIHSPKCAYYGGHFNKVLMGKEHPGVHILNLYHETKQYPYVGLFLLHNKVLMVNDLELIKLIMVKDHQYFPDHGIGISPNNDPLSNHLFNMEGASWKHLRAKLTPAFTSSKMKFMFDTMLQCGNRLEDYLEEQVEAGNYVDFKETMGKYTTDVIGSCAFGIEINSFKHSDNEFRKMGKMAFAIDHMKLFKELISVYAPSLVRIFKIRLIHKDIEDFFTNIVEETIKYREVNNVSRKDFLQILIDMKKKDEQNGIEQSFSSRDITAQVYLFFAAGFESSSSTASYALYEMSKNPKIQEKVHEEIDKVAEKYDGKITYESINEMEYLTQVIEETLRMYPPLSFYFRQCINDYTLPDSNIIIEKGTKIVIPVLGIHRDPEIHADPEEFRPERFFPENKAKMHPFASIPFGEGPRICIGSRFGLMQIRLGLVSILSKYRVSLKDEPETCLKFNSRVIALSAEGVRYMRVDRRKPRQQI